MSEAKDDQGATAKHGDGWLTQKEYARLTLRQKRKLKAQREEQREEERRKAYAAATAEGVAADYRAALEAMPAAGGRHAYVAKVVRVKAKRAAKVLGLDVATFIEDCQNAPNGKGLTAAELRSIWNWGHGAGEVQPVDADGVTLPDEDRPKREPPKPKPWERPPTDAERGFVRDRIARGATWLKWERANGGSENLKASRLLADVTRGTIPEGNAGQAAAMVRTLSDIAERLGVEGGGKWYAAERHEARDGSKVRTAADWCAAWLDGGEAVPSLMSINPHTGEGVERKDANGQPYMSYRTKETVARWLFALVEFDAMPLEDQALFWLGVLADGSLDVAAIVYSGGMSLHGVIVVPPTGAGEIGTEANYRAAWGKAKTSREAMASGEVETWGTLMRLLYSDGESQYRVDAQTADVLTVRLSGRRRTDYNPKKYGANHAPTLQRLLWLDDPGAREDVETPCEIEAEAVPPSAEMPDESDGEVLPPCHLKDGGGLCYACERHGTCSYEKHLVERPAPSERRCADCPAATVAACRRTYGRYWLMKSMSGEGCANAVAMDRMAAALCAADWPKCAEPKKPKLSARVEKVLAAIADGGSTRYDWDYVRRYVMATGIIPEWLARECGV